ncbi:hypothetical protein JTE90_004698 [Oedothorax gibbosus]|uniref:Uncharacterized protein n=1 Tax=Oedothorax gibbosus TaxID=931172 RepID=A0AAV6UA58_9ARAC|nr:hypothetical protein JTE90_004698 [Oedothorax gibbosus]
MLLPTSERYSLCQKPILQQGTGTYMLCQGVALVRRSFYSLIALVLCGSDRSSLETTYCIHMHSMVLSNREIYGEVIQCVIPCEAYSSSPGDHSPERAAGMICGSQDIYSTWPKG